MQEEEEEGEEEVKAKQKQQSSVENESSIDKSEEEDNNDDAFEKDELKELKKKTNNEDQNNNKNTIKSFSLIKDDDAHNSKKHSNKDLNNNYNKSKSTSSSSPGMLQRMPLPYKVAKSLDPVIYRNTAFDAWLATKKELEQAANLKAISSLKSGDKCMVKLALNSSTGGTSSLFHINGLINEKWTLAFVQQINLDTANVFVPEFNEKLVSKFFF